VSPFFTVHEQLIPVGKGIVSRAVLTGDTWRIADVSDEPDFLFFHSYNPQDQGSNATNVTNNADRKKQRQRPPADSIDRNLFRNMVVVPILDGRGRVIGVLEAMNKVHEIPPAEVGGLVPVVHDVEEDGFTEQDVEILKSLASHISVSLQSFYQDEEDDDMRLRDTIRIFKEMGIQGVTDSSRSVGGGSKRDGISGGLFPSSSPPSSLARPKPSKLFPDP
jgi:GAF domain-containing protein